MWAFRNSRFFHFMSQSWLSNLSRKRVRRDEQLEVFVPLQSWYQLSSGQACLLLFSAVPAENLRACFHTILSLGPNLWKWLSDNMEKLMPSEEDFYYLHFARERIHATQGQRGSTRFWSGGKRQEGGESLGQIFYWGFHRTSMAGPRKQLRTG